MKAFVRSALTGLALLTPASASAIDQAACAVPYEEAQVLRKKHTYRAAQEQLEACKTECPPVLAADCSQWAAELAALMPTVLMRVHDAGGRRVDTFRATVNGTLLTDAPGNAAIPLDPGEHLIHVEAPGYLPSDARALLNDGEHRRIIDVTLSLTPVTSIPAATPEAPQRPSRTPAYVFFGIAGVGLAGGGALSVIGLADKAYLEHNCAGHCTTNQVDTVRTLWISGGVAAGAGAASLAIGAVLWFRGSHQPTTAHARWLPLLGARQVGVVGEF